MDRKYLYGQWLDSQSRKANSKRKYPKYFIGERGYPHLDNKLFFPRIGNDPTRSVQLGDIVTSSENLKKYGFLPFIKKNTRQRRYREPPHDYKYSSLRGGRDQKLFPHIKYRPIMYAGHEDACIFSFYSFCLEQLYEAELINRQLQNNVIAYRSIDGKSNIDFAKEAFLELINRTEYDCIMIDVKSFFDTINHELLFKQWDTLLPGGFKANAEDKIIYENITAYRHINLNESVQTLRRAGCKYIFRERGCLKLCRLQDYNKHLKKSVRKNKSGRGIPQGSPISGMLANIYLLDFDQTMRQLIVNKYGGVYQRYSDDIFIVCPRGLATKIYKKTNVALAKEKLTLGINKTEAFTKTSDQKQLLNITHQLEPTVSAKRTAAQYLGFHFEGEHIILRPSTLSKHVRGRRNPNYLKSSYNKTLSPRVARQVNRIRRIVKSK